MESTGYTSLTRQSGLMREMQVIANNIHNNNKNIAASAFSHIS